MPAVRTKETTSKIRRNPAKGRKRSEVCGGGNPKGGNDTAVRDTLHTVRFASKPTIEVGVRFFGNPEPRIDLVSMYNDLYDAYSRYCTITGTKAKRKQEPGISSIRQLYVLLKKMVLKVNDNNTWLSIVLDSDKKRCVYGIGHSVNFRDTVYVVPLKILHYLKESGSVMDEVAIQFFGWMIDRLKITDWEDAWYVEYHIDMLQEEAFNVEEEDPKLAREILAEAAIYAEEGLAEWYLNRVKSYLMDSEQVADAVNNLQLKTKWERRLRNWILSGIELLESPNYRSVNDMQFPVTDNDGMHEGAVDVNRNYFVSWTDDGSLVERYIEGMNMDWGEYGSHSACEYLLADKHTERPFKYTGWIDNMHLWLVIGMQLFEEKKKTKLWKTLPE